MIPPEKTSQEASSAPHPTEWDEDTFRSNWFAFLEGLVKDGDTSIPFKRIRYQMEQHSTYQDVLQRWSGMNGTQRLDSWKKLLGLAENVSQEVLPTCVQCGECCRKGSPTLLLEDMDLLRQGKIQWNQLITLRRTEPVHSPFEKKLFFLIDERIKIREKSDTMECVFFDGETDECTIYADRPVQCRAQACWDSEPSKDLATQPYLTRKDIFKEVELLLEMIAEHDQRCSFTKLNEAYKQLFETRGKSVEEVLQLLAYEDHFRLFLGEQLKIPADTMDFVFGRSFAELSALFGFRVKIDPDGTRCLVPDNKEDTDAPA